jgi:RNA polymerase sigma-70 factor (ECF subfamily)
MTEAKPPEFEKWVETYTKDMLNWATYKLNSKENAEDLVQDTFFSAYKAMHNFKNDSNPKTWLFTILNNKITDYYRSRASKKEFREELPESRAEQATDSLFTDSGSWKDAASFKSWHQSDGHLLDNKRFLEVFDHCIEGLPAKWRELMVQRFIFNKKAEAIRKELELTQSNYWQLIHRAKLLLKLCIDKSWIG